MIWVLYSKFRQKGAHFYTYPASSRGEGRRQRTSVVYSHPKNYLTRVCNASMTLPIGTIVILVLTGIIILPLLWLVGKGETERDPEVQANAYTYMDDGDGDGF